MIDPFPPPLFEGGNWANHKQLSEQRKMEYFQLQPKPFVIRGRIRSGSRIRLSDNDFLGGLEMNRGNKTDPFMIISAVTNSQSAAARQGRYCREKEQDVGIFRAPQIGRLFPSVRGWLAPIPSVRPDCHFWQPHFGRFSSLPHLALLARVTW